MNHRIVRISTSEDTSINYLSKIGPSMVCTEDVWYSSNYYDAITTDDYLVALRWLEVAIRFNHSVFILSCKE